MKNDFPFMTCIHKIKKVQFYTYFHHFMMSQENDDFSKKLLY